MNNILNLYSNPDYLQILSPYYNDNYMSQNPPNNTFANVLSLMRSNRSQNKSVLDFLLSSSYSPQSPMLVSQTIQGYTQYNLKKIFQLANGQNVNVGFKLKQAIDAYSQNNSQTGQNYNDNEDYFSPKSTARRISNFAMEFMPAYQSNHNGHGSGNTVNSFFDLAKNAILKGLVQTKTSLGKLFGNKDSQTFDLISKCLEDVKTKMLGKANINCTKNTSNMANKSMSMLQI